MLARRLVEIRAGGPGLVQPLISRETLIDCGRAEALLAQAHERAAALLQEAERQAAAQLAEAQRAFWQQAEQQLKHWEQERLQMNRLLETHASQLVNQALQQLLGETPQPVRLQALLNQLLASQSEPVSATLRCHPQVRDCVQHWLDQQPATPWRLQPDASLADDEVQLSTEQGDFQLDWRAVCEALQLTAE